MALDINEKPWYVALIIGLALGGALYVAANAYLYKDQQKEIAGLEKDIDDLQREIEKGLRAKANLPKLESDIHEYEIELQRLTRILPTQKQTEQLIKKLKGLTEQGFFRMKSFRPGKVIDKKYYLERPIKVNLDGTYHQLGVFFDRLSHFPRIINVNELRIMPAQGKGKDYSVQASFTLRTFIYKESKAGGQ